MKIINQNIHSFILVAIFCKSIMPSDGFILIPEEVQSVLQLAYSFFPTINAGTRDSKIGVGFRLGKNADVQVLLEFGPETSSQGSTRRRQALIKGNSLDSRSPSANDLIKQSRTESEPIVNDTTTTEPSQSNFSTPLNNTIDP